MEIFQKEDYNMQHFQEEQNCIFTVENPTDSDNFLISMSMILKLENGQARIRHRDAQNLACQQQGV